MHVVIRYRESSKRELVQQVAIHTHMGICLAFARAPGLLRMRSNARGPRSVIACTALSSAVRCHDSQTHVIRGSASA